MDLLNGYSSSSSDESDESIKDAKTTKKNGDTALKKKKSQRGTVKLVDSNAQEASSLFVRTIPHQRGNWAGHVFIKVPPSSSRKARASVAKFCTLLKTAGWSGTVASHVYDLHISLSRPFFLQECNIANFVSALQQRVSNERTTSLVVIGEELLTNDDKTRSFWTWTLSNSTCMQRILTHVDEVLLQYQQPTFYKSPKFHVSLASLVGNVKGLLEGHTKSVLNDTTESEESENDSRVACDAIESDDESDDDDAPLLITIDCIYCTFGTTKTYAIPLRP